MAHYRKIGLLVLNEKADQFLACQKYAQNVTTDFIMPGGQLTEATDEECLRNEIQEELACEVDFKTLRLVGEYADVAAGRSDRDVSIKLYQGELVGAPTPSSEVQYIHWIGRAAVDDPRVSSIVRNKIIPDLIARNILR